MSEEHTIVLNGETRNVPAGTTIRDLLTELDVARTGFAVAVNADVIPRSQHDRFELPTHARVEVIRAVGGG